MKTINRGLAAVTLAGAASISGHAAADNVDRAAFQELFNEPVTTSATGAPQRATEAPVNMTIITQEDIQRSGATDIPGVLEGLANVDVMRSTRGQTDVAIRGYNAGMTPRLLVLVNGRQVYLDHYGMTNWDAIPVQLSEIQQIEVVSGPNTALFGFNAAGGVVNIITFDALRDDVDQVSVSAGTNGYAAGSAVWSMRAADNFGIRVSMGGFDVDASDGDDLLSNAEFGGDSLDPMARSASISAVYALSDKTRIEAEATWSLDERLERYQGSLIEGDYETSSLKLALFSDTDLGMFSAQIYSNTLDLSDELSLGTIQFDNNITVASASLIMKPAPAHTLRVAGEYRMNEYDDGLGTLSYDVYALSGMWNWQATSALSLTGAVRFDTLELGREGATLPLMPFTNADYDQDFSEWSYNLGAVYKLSDNDSLRFSAARGIGSPSLLEYGFQLPVPPPGPGVTAFYLGDPTSAPTIVYNMEFGWDHNIPSINGRLRASLFWQKNEDLRMLGAYSQVFSVAPVVAGTVAGNIGESEMQGIEVGIEGQQGRIHWDAQYSYRDVSDDFETLTSPTAQANFEDASPEHIVTGGVMWIGDRFEFGADARYTSETQQFGQGASLTGLASVDSYVQLNARAAWRASDTIRLELAGHNLLEEETQTVGVSPVERSVVLTLRSSF